MTNVCLNLKFRSWEMGHFSVRTVFSEALACSISDKVKLMTSDNHNVPSYVPSKAVFHFCYVHVNAGFFFSITPAVDFAVFANTPGIRFSGTVLRTFSTLTVSRHLLSLYFRQAFCLTLLPSRVCSRNLLCPTKATLTETKHKLQLALSWPRLGLRSTLYVEYS